MLHYPYKTSDVLYDKNFTIDALSLRNLQNLLMKYTI
jgi:hypothetical protein